MGGWQIVKFPEDDNKVEAVPSSWISKEQGKIMCFWPNTISSSKVLNYIKSQAQPQGDWKSYPVVILTQYPEESYSFACQKAKRAQYTSAVDTGEESEEDRISKRKRKKNHKYLSSESEDSPLKTARKTSRQLNKMPTPPDQTKGKQKQMCVKYLKLFLTKNAASPLFFCKTLKVIFWVFLKFYNNAK